jgi:hypothetical protein
LGSWRAEKWEGGAVVSPGFVAAGCDSSKPPKDAAPLPERMDGPADVVNTGVRIPADAFPVGCMAGGGEPGHAAWENGLSWRSCGDAGVFCAPEDAGVWLEMLSRLAREKRLMGRVAWPLSSLFMVVEPNSSV